MSGTKNIGTLVGAAIRPINDIDPIASAYANEIKGGIHSYPTLADRNSLIIQRREFGMLVTVYNDPIPSNNKTYQLKYLNTDLMDNNNWVEQTTSSLELLQWRNSVKSVNFIKPGSPVEGDRYLVGTDANSVLSGGWVGPAGYIAEYKNSVWTIINPTDGMSIRVNNEDNSIYRYGGTFSTGRWIKERVSQVYNLDFTGNGTSYTTTLSNTQLMSSYESGVILLSKFDVTNTGNVTINVNGLGVKSVKKPSNIGLIDLNMNDIQADNIYSLTYDGTYFQYLRTYSNDAFNNKYYIEPNEYLNVPAYCQYWVYGDLTVDGTLDISTNGEVVIANGGLIINGTVSNNGAIKMINIPVTGGTMSNSDIIVDTVANIISLQNANSLIPGKSYQLSDFETTYLQPQTNIQTSSGVIEQLILKASSSNSFHTEAISPLYPQDIIYFDLNDTTDGALNGKILRRIDTTRNNDISTDWRHIKYRRWALEVTNTWNISTTYGAGDVVEDGGKIYISTSSGNIGNAVTSSFWFKYVFLNGQYVSHLSTDISINAIGGIISIPVGTNFMDYTIEENTTSFYDNTFQQIGLNNCVFLGDVFANNINGMHDNTISNFTYNNMNGIGVCYFDNIYGVEGTDINSGSFITINNCDIRNSSNDTISNLNHSNMISISGNTILGTMSYITATSISNKDFSLSTDLLGKNYPHEIKQLPNGDHVYIYMDNTGSLVINNLV